MIRSVVVTGKALGILFSLPLVLAVAIFTEMVRVVWDTARKVWSGDAMQSPGTGGTQRPTRKRGVPLGLWARIAYRWRNRKKTPKPDPKPKPVNDGKPETPEAAPTEPERAVGEQDRTGRPGRQVGAIVEADLEDEPANTTGTGV